MPRYMSIYTTVYPSVCSQPDTTVASALAVTGSVFKRRFSMDCRVSVRKISMALRPYCSLSTHLQRFEPHIIDLSKSIPGVEGTRHCVQHGGIINGVEGGGELC